jgi:dienelactone hydrolase
MKASLRSPQVATLRRLVYCLSLSLSVVVCPGSLSAQQTDARLYRLFQGSMEVAREWYRITGRTYEYSMVIPLANLKLDSRGELDAAGRLVRGASRAFDQTGDTTRAALTIERSGDSLAWQREVRGTVTRGFVRGVADGVLPGQSVAAMAFAAERAAGRDTLLHLYPLGTDSILPVTVQFHGDTAVITLAGIEGRVLLRGGRAAQIMVPGSQARGDLWNGRDSLPPLPAQHRPRADYSAAPDAPHTAEAVRVPVVGLRNDTFSLGCTLTLPKQGGPRFPAAITLTGSGQQDRDENLWPLVPDYHLYRQVAERLGAAGIAVLRCDDYGFLESGGAINTEISMLDFANAARAQLAWLRARPDIDGAKLAVIGHSEGGIVGPMVAADDPRLAALVVMAGTAKTMDEVLRDQYLGAVERTPGLTPAERAAAREQALRDAAAFGGNAPGYMRFARTHDPLTAARRVRAPTLILQGMLDQQVTHGQADTLGAAMRGAGNRDVTVRAFDGLNHLFLVSPGGTGSPEEYATLREVAVPAAVLDTLAQWLTVKLRR